MTVRRRLASVVLVVALTGCAVLPLRYRYEEEPAGPGAWLVRAAERTRDAGFRYFIVCEFTGDPALHRRFSTTAAAAPPAPEKYGAEMQARLDRLDFLDRRR